MKHIILLNLFTQFFFLNYCFGQISFEDSNQQLGNFYSENVALADLDGDGDLDAFISNNVSNSVWLNNGTGFFENTNQNFGNNYTYQIALFDIDNDGDNDAVFANNGPNEIWFNNGDGTFAKSDQEIDSVDTPGAGYGDFNNDGYKDILFTNFWSYTPNEFWFNDSTGHFRKGDQSFQGIGSRVSVVNDFDNDGDLDAFICNHNGPNNYNPNQLLLNDGTGNFTDSGQEIGRAISTTAVSGDVDNDGDIDVIVGNIFDNNNYLWLNDSLGQFTYGQTLDINGGGVDLKDIDGDGDLDAFIARYSGDNHIWLNDGNGNFTKEPTAIGNITESWGIALGDLDGDGDIDAFIANNGPNEVWFNTTNDSISKINKQTIDIFKIYPNPAQNTLQIEYPGLVQKEAFYKIIDLSGKTIQQGKLTGNIIDVSKVSKGTYIFKMETDGKSLNQKFIIE